MAKRLWLAALSLALLASAAACDSSAVEPVSVVAPSPTPSVGGPAVVGTVWLHTREGIRPFSRAPLGGWVELPSNGGWRWGSVDDAAHYSLPAPDEALVRVQVAAGVGTYQPCAVTFIPGDRRPRDVHVVSDPEQLGARLSPDLIGRTRTLSGFLYEVDGDGLRVPVAQARVTLDAQSGLGFVAATTLTDSDGRYVLCGLDHDTSTYVFASKDGYRLFGQDVPVRNDTILDIQMRR